MTLPVTPACGAMRTSPPRCDGAISCQLFGYEMLSGPRSVLTSCWLGSTSFSATGPTGADGCDGDCVCDCDCEAGALTATPGGAWKTAPFCLFRRDHWPLFAPCEICSEV